MTITLDGTLGITSPAETVQGALTTTGNTILGDASTDTLNVGNGGLVKDASGNVGIGTASPAGKLDITGANVLVKATASSGFAGFYANGATGSTAYNFFAINGTETARIFSDSGNILAFATGSSATERMRIDSSGNLLVGTTSTINGRKTLVTYNDVTNNGFGINETTGASGAQFQAFFSNGTSCGAINRVGATSAVTYGTSSDYRLKKNILPMVGALEKVLALKPCTYTWKDCDADSQGFIAHELAEVCPDAVQGEKDATSEEEYEVTPAVPAVVDAEGVETTPAVEAVKGTRTVPSYQGIDTSFLVATLTAAIQEQQALITQLQADVAALKALSA